MKHREQGEEKLPRLELFAAANSGKGFYSFYPQVFEREGIEKRYVFCILSDNTPENKLSPAVVSSSIVSFLKENMY